jgi:hypothetical protein
MQAEKTGELALSFTSTLTFSPEKAEIGFVWRAGTHQLGLSDTSRFFVPSVPHSPQAPHLSGDWLCLA